MNDKKSKHVTNQTIGSVLVVVFVGMFILTSLTPMGLDDYSYCFSGVDGSRIRSVTQIVPAMALHRLETNGRVITHGIVQLLLMFPKPVFSIANSTNMVVLLMLLICFFPDCDKKKQFYILICAVLMIWNYTPSFGENYLWTVGSINYSWALTLYLIFLQPYISDYLEMQEKTHKVLKVLNYFIAFIAGAYSESSSLAVLFVAICLLALNWRKQGKIPALQVGWLLSFCLGYWFLMSAPATAGKAAALDYSYLGNRLRALLRDTKRYLFILYLIYACLLALSMYCRINKRVIITSILFLLAGMGSIAALEFAIYYVPRHFCTAVFFTVVAILLLLSQVIKKTSILSSYFLIAVLITAFVFQFANGVLDIVVSYHKSIYRQQQVEQAILHQMKTVTFENYSPSTGYAIRFYLYENPEVWPNNDVARYFGLEKVYGYDRPN